MNIFLYKIRSLLLPHAMLYLHELSFVTHTLTPDGSHTHTKTQTSAKMCFVHFCNILLAQNANLSARKPIRSKNKIKLIKQLSCVCVCVCVSLARSVCGERDVDIYHFASLPNRIGNGEDVECYDDEDGDKIATERR